MIHKSHSKNDLIDLINTIDIPVVFSHQNNKKDIQEKLDVYLKTDIDKTLDPNVYKINSKRELILYLKNPNPKKSLNVKEKMSWYRLYSFPDDKVDIKFQTTDPISGNILFDKVIMVDKTYIKEQLNKNGFLTLK